ncbi:MAG: quinone-dependent dihydroorotate dehydrogenase [Bdellovibrionales bacterium]
MRPWLWLPAGLAHRLSPWALQVYSQIKPLQTLTWSPFVWRDLEFTNRLGLAGGADKDGVNVQAWWTFGPGFLEIGTITPQPQPGNSGKRIDRDVKNSAVWNRLGFPSRGVEFVASRLKQLYQPRFTPIFANVGKNATTPLERAHEDYMACMRKLRGLVDAFIINISSPNTQGLRDLLKPENLQPFLSSIIEDNRQYTRGQSHTPILLKVSPDMSEDDLAQVLDTSLKVGLDGWVLTNSSIDLRQGLNFPKEGGVSGKPLSATAKRFLGQTVAHLGERRGDRLLISVGGVMTPDDVFERLDMGADLVQVYSALVMSGPKFFREVADHAAIKVKS